MVKKFKDRFLKKYFLKLMKSFVEWLYAKEVEDFEHAIMMDQRIPCTADGKLLIIAYFAGYNQALKDQKKKSSKSRK